MGALETLIYGYRTILNVGSEMLQRSKLNFASGFVVSDNPSTGSTDISVDVSGLDNSNPVLGQASAILGQSSPSATTLTDLYTVPALTAAVVKRIYVCNQNASYGVKVRISVAVAGAADTAKQYLYQDFQIDTFSTLEIEADITLGAGDVLRVQADTASVSFSAFGIETAVDPLKVLGQAAPAANTATTLYTVPGGKTATVSSIFACNQNTSSGPTNADVGSAVRVWIRKSGDADNAKQYLFYDQAFAFNDTLTFSPNIKLAAGDSIRIQGNLANISFNAFGEES